MTVALGLQMIVSLLFVGQRDLGIRWDIIQLPTSLRETYAFSVILVTRGVINVGRFIRLWGTSRDLSKERVCRDIGCRDAVTRTCPLS